jgi:hypothetical protein
MTVWNLGSINLDHVYRVPHLPAPGETLAAEALTSGLGGKGANQSIAAARAGARVAHIGRIGADGGPAGAALAEAGVDVTHVTRSAQATGHAIILVDAAGENSIVIHPGANRDQQTAAIDAALSGAAPGDTLLLQNETDAQVAAAGIARAAGLRVVYSRIWRPDWEPSGTFTRDRPPSIVGTSTSPPSAARSSTPARGSTGPCRRAGTADAPQLDEDVEIARGPAAQAGLALAGQADARAGFDPCGDVDVERAVLLRPGGARRRSCTGS